MISSNKKNKDFNKFLHYTVQLDKNYFIVQVWEKTELFFAHNMVMVI